MRYYTDLYIQALKAGAKPLIHCYVKSDYAWRCFGKEYPKEAHLRTDIDVYEWQARVLNFGDYRVSLASESENVFLALQSQEMNSYTITLDNADRYFTELLEDEVLLSGGLFLFQGFAYPEFSFDDFIPLFSGKISKVELSTLTCQLTADTIIKPAEPEDPSVDTTKTYSASVDLETETVAEETLTYETLESWYELETWTLVLEIDRTADDVEEVLLSIVNAADSAIRLEVGIDADDKLYLKYDTDIDDSSTTEAYTGFDVGTGFTRLVIQVDPTADPPVVNFSDNHNNVVTRNLSYSYAWEYIELFATNASFPSNVGLLTRDNTDILVKCAGHVYRYDSTGAYVSTIDHVSPYPYIAFDEYGNYYITLNQYNLAKYNSSGVQQWIIGKTDGGGNYIYGNGNGEFSGVFDIAYSSTYSLIYVCDLNNGRIQYFDLSGAYVGQWNTGGKPLHLQITAIGNVYVLNAYFAPGDTASIKGYTESGSFIHEYAIDDFLEGTFTLSFALDRTLLYCYRTDTPHTVIFEYDTSHTLIDTIIDTHINLSSSWGIVYYLEGSIPTFLCGSNPKNIEKYQYVIDTVETVDFSDNGSDDTVSILPGDNNSALISAAVLDENGDPVLQWQNVGDDSAVDLVDQIGDADVALADGVWTESGTIEAYTEVLTSVEQVSYDTEFIPATTDRYTNSSQQNVFLPIPYGDMNENSDAGAWVAPCIDTIHYVYCVAGCPILSEASGNIVNVYVDGVLQTSGYTFDESNDYEGQGNIAILTFTSDLGNSVVTVSCRGRDSAGDGTGTLLTNPIDIIEDLLDYASTYFDNSVWNIDELSFAMAKEECLSHGYICAGVINAAQPLTFWIKSILASFLMTYEFDNEGRLAIRFLKFTNTEDIKETIEEYQAITIKAVQQYDNLCNRLIINYANSYAEIDR